MVRQTVFRVVVRGFVGFSLVLIFIAAYLHLNWDPAELAIAAARTARYVTNDTSIEFTRVASFDAPATENIRRTAIKIDPFGETYVSLDGSDIAVGDPG